MPGRSPGGAQYTGIRHPARAGVVPPPGAGENGYDRIQPIGAFKGLGLVVCMGILSSLLSGAGYGAESGNMVDGAIAGADGQFYMAINVAFFEDAGRFKIRVDEFVHPIRTSRCAGGTEALFAPGGLEVHTAARNREAGIPLSDTTLDDIREAAAELGVPDFPGGPGLSPSTPSRGIAGGSEPLPEGNG